jgi:hypothetical protein
MRKPIATCGYCGSKSFGLIRHHHFNLPFCKKKM